MSRLQANGPNEARDELSRWAAEGHRNAAEIADMLGISGESYADDPLVLLAALQSYVDRLPLSEFEQEDWLTLHSDLVSFLADVLIRRRGAAWTVVDDSSAPNGFRFVLTAESPQGDKHQIDPYRVVMEEFQNVPIEVTRLISSAELTLGVARPVDSE